MKKRVAILCGLVLTLTLVVMAQTNSGIFRITNSNFILNGVLGFESSAGAGMDAAIVRTGANALKVTGGDASTAAALTASSVAVGTAGTTAGSAVFSNATSGSVTLAPVTGALGTVTVSLPAATGTIPLSIWTSCANSLSCATPATTSSSVKVAYGTGALSSASPSLAHVTGIAPAFADTSHMFCVASAVGTSAAIAAGGLAVNLVSSSAFDVTGPNTVTTSFNWTCMGT